MKNILIIVLFTINLLHSQTIKNIDGVGKEYAQPGVYYQDVNFVFDPFVGTYIYSNGNEYFEIRLQKKIASSNNGIYTEDMIIGSYKYVDANGVEKVNVLNDLKNNFSDGDNYKINGNYIVTGTDYGCNTCSPNEKWLYISIEDPASGKIDQLLIRKIIVNNQDAISIFILHSIRSEPAGTIPIPISYPISQDIILLKQ